jgi:hypothetical protein
MSYIEKEPYYGSDFITYDYDPSGWVMFAGLMVFFIGLWDVIEAVIALFRTSYFTGTAVFGDLFFWALVWFAVGLAELVAGYGIISGRTWARVLGIVLVVVSAIVNMLTIPLYPWWSIFVVAFDVVILYALTVRWRPGATEPAAS